LRSTRKILFFLLVLALLTLSSMEIFGLKPSAGQTISSLTNNLENSTKNPQGNLTQSFISKSFTQKINFQPPSWLKTAEEKIAPHWHPHPPTPRQPHYNHLQGAITLQLSGTNSPQTIWNVYGISSLGCSLSGYPWGDSHLCGYGQVIGVIDWYDDPNIANDLITFSNEYGLPACTASNGCFNETKEYINGQPPLQPPPGTISDTSAEISLDVEWAHAIAPGAKILLFEDYDPSQVFSAVQFATAQPNVHQVSMSFGSPEDPTDTSLDGIFQVSGVSFFAGSGDSGNGVNYPCVSPWVVCVGGTSLTLDNTGKFQSEIAWSGSSGGESAVYSEPQYQKNLGISSSNSRAVPDVSLSATSYPIVDSYGCISSSCQYGIAIGTSASTPVWAAISAIANSQHSSPLSSTFYGTLNALYGAASGSQSNPQTTPYTANYRDIITGSNGACGAICNASVGYDEVTGLGSPKTNNLISFLSPNPPTSSSPPTGLTATAVSSSQINLSWTAPSSNGGSPITGYKIEQESPIGGGFPVTPLVTNTGTISTKYSDTGLKTGTQYNYKVSAINLVGTSTPSGSAHDTTFVPGPPACPSLPISGYWIVSSSCTLTSTLNLTTNAIVQNNSILTIPSGLKLHINFNSHYLLVKSGSGVLIKAGGAIN
jgi:subtilase family serine protease